MQHVGDLLMALQHADSAFPSGGFAFSQGLEGFAALLGRPNAPILLNLLRTQIRLRWATADRVALILAHRAGTDFDTLAQIDAEVEATTMPEPLRTGSRRNGAAFLSAYTRLGSSVADAYLARARAGSAFGHLVVAQGTVWASFGIGRTDAAAMSGYVFAAGIAQAAVRLGFVGALDAQRILSEVRVDIAEAADEPLGADTVIESYTPLTDIGAMRHARQDTRLFGN